MIIAGMTIKSASATPIAYHRCGVTGARYTLTVLAKP